MKPNVMVDLETLGTEPGAVILSIGAVRFDNNEIGEEFYADIDPRSCENYGLTINADTLTWWLNQDESVKDVLTGGGELDTALNDFALFVEDAETVWANSPTFDCAILRAAYDAIDEDVPWSYRNERDFRTLADLPIAPSISFDGDKHNAVDDARHQAEVTIKTLSLLNELIDDQTDENQSLIERFLNS